MIPTLAVGLVKASQPIVDTIEAGDGPCVFSHFRLVKGYTGYCRQVKRLSDNTTLDVGFTAGGFYNVRAEINWADGANTVVTRIYNQNPQTGQPPYLDASGANIQGTNAGAAVTFNGYPAMLMGSTSVLATTDDTIFVEEYFSVIWLGKLGTQSGAKFWTLNADGDTAATVHFADSSGRVQDIGPYDWNGSPIWGKKFTHINGAGGFANPTLLVTTYESATPFGMTAWTNGYAVSVLDIDDTKPATVDYVYLGPIRLLAGGGATIHTFIVDGAGSLATANLAKSSFNARNWIY